MNRCEMTAQRPDGSVVAPFDPYSGSVDYANLQSSYPSPSYPANARNGSIRAQHTQIGIFIFTLRCQNSSGWSGLNTMTHQVRTASANNGEDVRMQQVASVLSAMEAILKMINRQLDS